MPEQTSNTFLDIGYNEWYERPISNAPKQVTMSPSDISGSISYGSLGASRIGALLNFTTTIIFSATDYNTAAWAEGVISFPDGTTTETIAASNTGDIAANTYVYYDKTQKGRLVITTSPADAVGEGRTLLCAVEKVTDVTMLCKVTPMFATGIVISDITANQITANTITANEIAANTITVTELNFTPATSTNVIATINASAEGITIEADNIAISGSTTFSSGYDPADVRHASDVTKIDGGDVYTGTITATQILGNTITASEIASGTITTTELAANTIVVGDINSTVYNRFFTDSTTRTNTEAWKHASDATKIDGGDIYTNTVTATQVAAGTITTTELAANTIVVGDIDSTVYNRFFTDSTTRTNVEGWKHGSDVTKIDGGDVYTNTITATQIAASTITTTELAANTIVVGDVASSVYDRFFTDSTTRTNTEAWKHASDATKIDGGDVYTNTITATQIAASTITATEISGTQLDVVAANTGTLDVDEYITLGADSNIKIDGANKYIIINDGTDDRVLIGYDSGGF